MELAPSAHSALASSQGYARRIYLPDPLPVCVGDNRRPVRPILPRHPIADDERLVVLEC